MANYRPFVLVCLFPGLACSRVNPMRRPANLDEATQIASMPGKSEVEVKYWTVHGQASRRGTVAPFDAQTFVVTEPSGATTRIPFSSAQSISFKDHRKGGTDGFIAGALTGGLLGFITGGVLGGGFYDSDRPASEQDHSLSLGATGLLVGGVLFGLIDGVIGSAVGHRTTLTF